jgi:4-hydroxy-tetrahydrodipicolinate synthase
VSCAALTPVAADLAPDVPALALHCRWLLEQNCDRITLLGITGEANSFSVDERKAILEGVVQQGIPADRLLPGTGCAALSDTTALTQHAVELGVAAVVVLPPFC